MVLVNPLLLGDGNTGLLLAAHVAAVATQHLGEANLVVDALHALEVGLSGTLGTKDDVLDKPVVSHIHPLSGEEKEKKRTFSPSPQG